MGFSVLFHRDQLLRYNIIECKESKECRKEITNMELAKVTSKGQITIPIAIRNALGIREGDKILFYGRRG